MATAVITGGSSGLGLAFATELAMRGYDLILVARDQARLDQVAAELSDQYDVAVDAISLDLSNSVAVDQLINIIKQEQDLEYMINNAGFAVHARADQIDAEIETLYRNALEVMALNTTMLSAAAAENMRARGHGYIINIASISSWLFNGVYSAIKQYILTYTESLAVRLRGSGVNATAVCPAWLHTNFHSVAGLGEPNIPEWLYITADQVVQASLRGAKRGKRLVIPSWKWRAIVTILKFMPRLVRRVISAHYLGNANYDYNKNDEKDRKESDE